MMSYPIFSPSNLLVRPKTHLHGASIPYKTCFFEFPTLKTRGAPLTSPSTPSLWWGGWVGGWGGGRTKPNIAVYTDKKNIGL